jgi:response regulator of citrate/malate metabolism
MFDHPLRQFSYDRLEQALTRLEEKKMTLERLRDMTADEIGEWSVASCSVAASIVNHFSQFLSLIENKCVTRLS